MSTNNYKNLEKKLGEMTVANYLKAFRLADEISQVDFAKKLGLSKGNLCDIEKGRKMISPKRASKIAKKIKVPEKVLIQLALQDSLRAARLKYKVDLKSVS